MMRQRPLFLLLLFTFSLWLAGGAAQAQESATATPWLFITASNASSPPSIELQAYGVAADGVSLSLSVNNVRVEHGGQTAVVQSATPQTVGTLTVFLVDIPPGVSDQIEAIQNAILQFASEPTMREGVDYVAVYSIGEAEPKELLAPTPFHNSVRNLFANPLPTETGATALIDSTMAMLDKMPELKPQPEMIESLVVLSDGTDAVSTRYTANDIAPRAASLGIPIHTIWLRNSDLPQAAYNIGQNYLQSISAGSRGLATLLENSSEVAAIWSRIAQFREQTRLRYVTDNLTGGQAAVTLTLVDNPEARAQTAVEVSSSMPSVVIELPLESRVLTLPNLDNPVTVRLQTTVSWLDGVTRQVEAAQLVVNGMVVQDIPVNTLDSFTARINNFVYSENTLQIAILDSQGIPASSPPVVITVQEGARDIPADLAAGGGLGRTLLTLFGVVLLLGLAGGLVFLLYQRGVFARLAGGIGRRGAKGGARDGGETAVSPTAEPIITSSEPLAYLEILEAVTRMPDYVALTTSVVRLGRSPAQADIAFENDITVSRLHATLHLEGIHYRIFDERSTSGTWVNEQQTPEYGIQLMDGDEIHLGAVHLRYREG
jgi:hypothetical protein